MSDPNFNSEGLPFSTSAGPVVDSGMGFGKGNESGASSGTGSGNVWTSEQASDYGTLALDIRSLNAKTDGFMFATAGDTTERQYWPIFMEDFPNCEKFWKKFITPLTLRIEEGPAGIRNRAGIDGDLVRISHLHYAVFLQLAAAFDHLPLPSASHALGFHFFGDFYAHLGSTCDVVEEFLFQVFKLDCECRGHTFPEQERYTKEEFLRIAESWFEEKYEANVKHYHKKGKSQPVQIRPRDVVLDKYFTSDLGNVWKEYLGFTRELRTYRNRIVHDIMIGSLISAPFHLVPKKKQIDAYPRIQDVIDAANDPGKISRDFAIRELQMVSDFRALQQLLNKLWGKPVKDFQELLYRKRNAVLLKKYNLRIEPAKAPSARNS